jgi:hypothetical protein
VAIAEKYQVDRWGAYESRGASQAAGAVSRESKYFSLVKSYAHEYVAGMTPFARFHGQVNGTLQMLRYLLMIQETFPHVMLQLTKEQTRALREQTLKWIEFCREIYNMPQLGCDPPRPVAINPNCPPHLLSDEIKKCLGRNHAFFDFVNAPFTHPIGTQLSVTCISSAWNAYDTFVNEISGRIKADSATDDRVQALLQAELDLKNTNPLERLPSDTKLGLLGIAATPDDFAKAARDLKSHHFEPDHAERFLIAGKDIRSTFTHRLGEPTDRLQKMMRDHSFEDLGFRMMPEGFEVTLLASRNIIEVILIKVVTIHDKAQNAYPEAGPVSGE